MPAKDNIVSVFKCIKTNLSVPQQGIPSNAIFYSTFALKDNTKYNGSRPLILLGPNGPDEASTVLNVVRFYRKLMVRNGITRLWDRGGDLHVPVSISTGFL